MAIAVLRKHIYNLDSNEIKHSEGEDGDNRASGDGDDNSFSCGC